jgi:hypothetical protein
MTALEGWRSFVNADPSELALLSASQWEALDEWDRRDYAHAGRTRSSPSALLPASPTHQIAAGVSGLDGWRALCPLLPWGAACSFSFTWSSPCARSARRSGLRPGQGVRRWSRWPCRSWAHWSSGGAGAGADGSRNLGRGDLPSLHRGNAAC